MDSCAGQLVNISFHKDFETSRGDVSANDTIKKVKGQHTEWEKIFVDYIFKKGLIFRIYKELLELSDKKITQF